MYTNCKNPVMPHEGYIPVVVSITALYQNALLPSGIFWGAESEIPKGGWRGAESEIPKGGWRGAESEIPKGGWRASSPVLKDIYRATTGHLFEFAFYPVGGHYEIDILSMPSYGSRSTSLHATHRLDSNQGNDKRVCFGDDSSVSTLDEARTWAASWAEHTMKYINNGVAFPNE